MNNHNTIHRMSFANDFVPWKSRLRWMGKTRTRRQFFSSFTYSADVYRKTKQGKI